MSRVSRRNFMSQVAGGVGALTLAPGALGQLARPEYRGPNVIIIRFGGGVRRLETIDPGHTHSPFLLHEITRRGIIFPKMEIASIEGVETSHGQGTLNILTGTH